MGVKILSRLIEIAIKSALENHRNPTTLDNSPEFARLSGSGRISGMPKIENSFAKKITLDYTLFHPEFSIFVHNAIKDKVNKKDKIIDIDKDSYKVLR